MDPLQFIITVVLITASGALAPGPLFVMTISHGTKLGVKSGVIFSVAHTIIEVTLIVLFTVSLLPVAGYPVVKITVGVIGGIFLIVFGAMQIRDSIKSKDIKIKPKNIATRNLLLIGLASSGLNPFLIIWWLTAGANLILLALEFGALGGVMFMYISHVWMDYVWLMSIAYLAKKGATIVGFKGYRMIMVVFGVILIYFGASFLINVTV